MNASTFKITAKTMYGLEQVTAQEILNIGGRDIEIGNRMVAFTGSMETLYRANIQLRTALKVLIPILSFEAKNEIQLYNYVKDINWDEYITHSQTIAVDGVVNSTRFNHSRYVALKVKDAVVDYFKEKHNRRPSVDAVNPALRINIHISEEQCTVSLDSSGESLHKRGYRVAQSSAPINEVLAAGMIMLTGWDGDTNLIDPMCGSGTIPIEAALIAYGIPPGIFRNEFAFEKWANFDQELFSNLIDSDEYYREFTHHIIGSDISAQTLKTALDNAKAASIHKKIDLKASPFAHIERPGSEEEGGIIIMNPPYGERLKPFQINQMYKSIGDKLKKDFFNYEAWIISSNTEAMKNVGLRPSKRIKLINGKLECSYQRFSLYKGSKKAKYQK